MTTITPWGSGAYAASRSDATFRSIKGSLGDLQVQLSTGKTATTYAALGADTAKSLSAHAVVAKLSGYANTISDAQLRVQIASTSVTQIQKLGASLATGLAATSDPSSVGATTVMASAADGMSQAVDLLNADLNGRYLFSGRTSDTRPVASYDLIMNGDATRAGLKEIVSERQQADLGASGLGRLAIATTGTGVTLSGEAANLPFGMMVQSASSSASAVSAATSAGPPASATFTVGTQPAEGDTVTVQLGMPDGTSASLTLTATTGSAGSGTFAVGATPADTAANLAAALRTGLATTATTTLASASASKAAQDFFAGSASNPPVRVAGPPYGTATATVAGTAANTVIWYTGDDAAGSARATAPVRTGDGTSVAIGLRADEAPFRDVMAALGSLAADSFSPTDATSSARYAAAASRAGTLAGGADVEGVSSDLSAADAALGSAWDRTTAATAQFQNIVDGIETADPTEVATKLLAVQTRLQASYQTTATIAKLSLTDYL